MKRTLGPLPGPLGDVVREWIRLDGSWGSRFDCCTLGHDLWDSYGMDAEGGVYIYDGWEEVVKLVEDGPRKVHIVALISRRRPELRSWLPLRPAAAGDCTACRGTGWVHPTGPTCEACLALGWLPPE